MTGQMDGEAGSWSTSGNIGFPPLARVMGVGRQQHNIVPGMFVCSSFLISVCMFIVSKVLLISNTSVIVRAGGDIWLNPFATVLFSVCSAVAVDVVFCTRVS